MRAKLDKKTPTKAVRPPLKTLQRIFGYIGRLLGVKNATGAFSGFRVNYLPPMLER